MQPLIKLAPKGLRWLRSGHLWVYRDDLQPHGAVDSGEIVRVEAPHGIFLGQGFYSQKSKIALRLISDQEGPADVEFFRGLIERARDRRAGYFSPETACRLVSAEGDLFPGLIADWYAGHLVLQTLVPGTARLEPMLIELFDQLFSPASITLRNDAAMRELEGLDQEKRMAKGEPQRAVPVREGEARWLSDLWEGHKTGAYLDQRENRIAARTLARGRALDAFCYQGHFSLQLAGGCDEVLALDGSAPALDRLRQNCELNGIGNVRARKANVFDELARLDDAGERFDLVVLDPPPFARARKDLAGAARGYRELNRRALSLLAPGGRLLTYSCSYNLSAEMFLAVLREAGADARRQVWVEACQTQAADHPRLLAMPETNYLKGFVLAALD